MAPIQPVKPVEVAPNHWRWEIKECPHSTLRDLQLRPLGALAARMSVQWGDAAVDGKDNQWRAIGQWMTNSKPIAPIPSPEITAQTQNLIAGAPDFYTKLSRITEYIQKNIRYFIVERGIGGWQAHHAADIFRNRYGDCKDKTTLLISMLQAVGIHADYLPVDIERGVVDPDAPSLYRRPHDYGHRDSRRRAGSAPDGHCQSQGRQALSDLRPHQRTHAGGQSALLRAGRLRNSCRRRRQPDRALPVLEPDANGTERKGAFTLAADGTLTGTVDTSHTGRKAPISATSSSTPTRRSGASTGRQVVAEDPARRGAGLLSVHPALGPRQALEFHYKVTARQYAHQAGPLLLVRPARGRHLRSAL